MFNFCGSCAVEEHLSTGYTVLQMETDSVYSFRFDRRQKRCQGRSQCWLVERKDCWNSYIECMGLVLRVRSLFLTRAKVETRSATSARQAGIECKQHTLVEKGE
jgi:hypothetical protein